jgi:hypothetical protein
VYYELVSKGATLSVGELTQCWQGAARVAGPRTGTKHVFLFCVCEGCVSRTEPDAEVHTQCGQYCAMTNKFVYLVQVADGLAACEEPSTFRE